MNQMNKVPTWYYVISVILLTWNLMGVSAFIMQMNMGKEQIDAMTEAERIMYENYPIWAILAFALAVFGSTLGSAGMILRMKWSKLVLIASLGGVLIQMFYNVFMSGAMDVYGPGAAIMPVMVAVISVFLVWFSDFALKKGWLK